MFALGFTKIASGSERLQEILKKWQEHNKRLPKPTKIVKPAVAVKSIIKKSSDMSMKPKKGETKLQKKLREQAEITSLGS